MAERSRPAVTSSLRDEEDETRRDFFSSGRKGRETRREGRWPCGERIHHSPWGSFVVTTLTLVLAACGRGESARRRRTSRAPTTSATADTTAAAFPEGTYWRSGQTYADHLAALVEAGYSNKEAEDISGPKSHELRGAVNDHLFEQLAGRDVVVERDDAMRSMPRAVGHGGGQLRQALGQLLSGGTGPLAPGKEMT
jgi:hypothetical protein